MSEFKSRRARLRSRTSVSHHLEIQEKPIKRPMIHEIVDIPEWSSTDQLLERIAAVPACLPDLHKALVRFRDDALLGQIVSITFCRPVTTEELRFSAYGAGV